MPINNALTPEGLNALGAAFGYYPQLRRNRTVQDPRAALDMPVQALRGRLAATAGMPSDILNMLRTPTPMEMYGDTDYGPQTQVPYGSQELLKTLPLAPQGPAQQAAANLGALAPMTPAEALQAARLARQAALASGRVVGEQLASRMMQGKSMILGLPVELSPSPLKFAVEPNVNQLAQIAKPKAEVSPLGFYSAVEQQALNLPRKQGTGESFFNDLAKGQDVKKYEMETMGLDEFLKGRSNVTRQEVQDFIASNRINVQEKQLGGAITEDPVGIAKRKEIFDKYEPRIQALDNEISQYNKALDEQIMIARDRFADAHDRLNTRGYMPTGQDYEAYNAADAELQRIRLLPRNRRDFSDRQNALRDARDAEANAAYVVPESTPTKYDKYQLPGGENYREILLTLPSKAPKLPEGYSLSKMSNGEFTLVGPDGSGQLLGVNTKDAALSEVQRRFSNKEPTFSSSHFNEPNILAHMRVNDRVDADGKKMLLIEEVQSDWHQAGRERGYATKNARTATEVERELTATTQKRSRLLDEAAALPDSEMTKFKAINEEIKALSDKATKLNEEWTGLYNKPKGVPDAPFKDTWHQLALKRALKEAVDKGYDRIGLTTGKQQAERFNLSKSINDLQYDPKTKTLSAWDHSGNKVVEQTDINENQLAEYIGKEGAQKLLAQNPKDTHIKQLFGADLEVGGEGMKKYYDEIYPAFLNKQGKKYGAEVGETYINTNAKTQTKDQLAKQIYGSNETYKNLPSEQKRKVDVMFMDMIKEEKIRYLDITPEMREAVKKGQPLASITNHLANAMA